MTEKNPSVMDVLCRAFDESGGKTIDLFMDHGELPGLKTEMMDWWIINQSKEDRYRKWYPRDHVSCKYEEDSGIKGTQGVLCIVVESMGEFPASALRIRPEDPPGWSSVSDANDRRVMWIHEVIEETANGIKMYSTFRLPAKTPKKLIEAMRRHNIEEMALLPGFLPEMYRKAVG